MPFLIPTFRTWQAAVVWPHHGISRKPSSLHDACRFAGQELDITHLCLPLHVQVRGAVLMSLSTPDRMRLVGEMDEDQVAELLSVLAPRPRAIFLEDLALEDSTLATCAVDAVM